MSSIFDKVDTLEDQDVNDIVQVINAAAVEAEPRLQRATACDFTVMPVPAPPAGTGVPAVKSGTYGVDLSLTRDTSSSDEESPRAEP
jgi:hypothetical protein